MAARQFGQLLAERSGPAATREMIPLYRALADLARTRGEPRVAVRVLERASDVEPGNDHVRLELARALFESGARDPAVQIYRSVSEMQAQAEVVRPATLHLLGEVAMLLGNEADAIRHFRRYLEIAPSGPSVSVARQRLRELESAVPDSRESAHP